VLSSKLWIPAIIAIVSLSFFLLSSFEANFVIQLTVVQTAFGIWSGVQISLAHKFSLLHMKNMKTTIVGSVINSDSILTNWYSLGLAVGIRLV
jgi:hypothetical protein